MTALSSRTVFAAGLTAALWVVPSIGTQGMGTLGQRFSHPDEGLVTTLPEASQRAVFLAADARVIKALRD